MSEDAFFDPIARGLGAGASNSIASRPRVAAFSRLKALLASGQPVVTIANYSDSLANEPQEWGYRFCQMLATKYPDRSVIYYLVNNSSPYTTWAAPVTIQTGTGSNTIVFRNFAIPGSRPVLSLGGAKSFCIETASPDLIMLSHGANCFVGLAAPRVSGQFWEWLLEIDYYHPGVPIVAMRQPPFRADNANAAAHDAVMLPEFDRVMQRVPQVSVVDAFAAFAGADLSASSPLYLDNVHLTEVGQTPWVAAIAAAWDAAVPESYIPRLDLNNKRHNLLHGGDLATWSAGLPVSDNGTWQTDGSAVVTEVASPSDRRGKYATIASAGSANSGLRWRANSTYLSLLSGKRVTLAVRMLIPSGNVSTSGRVQVTAGSPALGTQTAVTAAATDNQGDWRYSVISGFAVPSDASYLDVAIRSDTGTSTGQTVRVESVVLAAGDIPHVV